MSGMRVHLIISGSVQGVFFRFSMHQEAKRLGLEGWAKNCSDGTVEAVLEGEKETLETLISWCRKGPPAARVERVNTKWEKYQGEFNSFFIR